MAATVGKEAWRRAVREWPVRRVDPERACARRDSRRAAQEQRAVPVDSSGEEALMPRAALAAEHLVQAALVPLDLAADRAVRAVALDVARPPATFPK
jgi:hypothetical protein